MKTIYVSHSKQLNYKKELYEPLKKLKSVKLILPHEKSKSAKHSKAIIKKCSLFLADISYPSISVGIEIGWADSYNIPIILVCKKGSKISSSVKLVSKRIIEYDKIENIIGKIENVIFDF